MKKLLLWAVLASFIAAPGHGGEKGRRIAELEARVAALEVLIVHCATPPAGASTGYRLAQAVPPTDLGSVTPIATDEFYLIDDPGGSPVSTRATVGSLATPLAAYFLLLDASNDPLTAPLEVEVNGTAAVVLHSTDTNGGRWTMRTLGPGTHNDGNYYVRNVDDARSPFQIEKAALGQALYVAGDGVGLLNPAPDAPLEVGDANQTRTLTSAAGSILAGGGTTGRLHLEGSAQADLLLDDSGGALNEKLVQLFNAGGITAFRVLNDAVGIAQADVIVIDNSSGDVGIGTAAPASALDVAGTITIGGLLNLTQTATAAAPTTTEYPSDGDVGVHHNTGNGFRYFVWNDGGTIYRITLSTVGAASEKSWSFISPAGSSGTFYYGGFYDHGGADNDFTGPLTHGSANSSYAAHFFTVCAAGGSGGTDTVVRVTGTSITDAGVRTASDTEDLTFDDAGAAGAYYETAKKFIGQVTVAKQSGPDHQCNYGWAKYWDNNNTYFTVTGFEATWLGGANDTGFNMTLRHHKASGWTYNAGSSATPPAGIASIQGDHVTEYAVVNNENGGWKRSNLSTAIDGGDSEGTIWEIVTTSNKAIELGNILMRIAQ